MNLNKVMIIGNLTRDPELKTVPSGVQVATFGVATSHVWTDASGKRQEKTDFHNIVIWRRLAEIAAQYLRKGSKVYIEGRLQYRDWTGQDGVKRMRAEIIADNMIMLDRAGQGVGPSFSPSRPAGNSFDTNQGQMGDDQIPTIQADDDIRVENIPF